MRYFLSMDGDGHWYLIPEECRDDWYAWCDLDPDEDENAWDPPDWATAIGSSPTLVTFEAPQW